MKVNFMKFKDVLNLVLCEERDIGSFETTDGIWEVEIYDNEGNYPHVHVTTPFKEVAAPRLDIADYFIHEGKKYILNSQERKAFEQFMSSPSIENNKMTNWQFCVYVWNQNRINKINCEKPNYRFLPVVSSSKAGRNNKYKR